MKTVAAVCPYSHLSLTKTMGISKNHMQFRVIVGGSAVCLCHLFRRARGRDTAMLRLVFSKAKDCIS